MTLFFNTLTTDDKYCRRNMLKFKQQFEGPLSQKQKTFCGFFIAFLKCPFHLENLKKKMSILAYFLPELLTHKEVVT